MTEKEIRNGVKKVAATSPHGVCLWARDTDTQSRTYLSMAVVKIDSCEPDWDYIEMQYGFVNLLREAYLKRLNTERGA